MSSDDRRAGLRQMLNKVPEVTVYFWVIKVLCTTVGETASDYLSDNVGLGLTKTTFITAALLLVDARVPVPGAPVRAGDLLARDRADQRRRHADHRQPLRQLRRLAGHDDDVFASCSRSCSRSGARVERTLSIHTIYTTRREALLLARGAVHVRARHGGRRPDGRAANVGYASRWCCSPARSRRSPSRTTAST